MTNEPEASSSPVPPPTSPTFDAKTGQWLNAWGKPTFQGQPIDAGLQPDGRFVLKLETPVQLGERGEERTEIVFRRPNGKTMRTKPLQPQTSGEIMLWALKLVSADGQPLTQAEFDILEGDDVFRFEEVAVGFFSGTTADIGCAPLEQLQRRFLPGGQESS